MKSPADGIRFGIPELDRMLDLDTDPAELSSAKQDRRRGTGKVEVEATSLAIVGPDGTGKSVLALHLASRYFADHCLGQSSRVIYVSTDLKHELADKVWGNFDLGAPYRREIPFERARRRYFRTTCHSGEKTNVCLRQFFPREESDKDGSGRSNVASKSLVSYLSRGDNLLPEVCFLDLASVSAGDDWAFLTRLVAHLSGTREGRGNPHLLIIDSIAGLETLVGDMDGFGERTSRRARIAQVMRAARNDCHIVFVVEEPKPGEVLPEEYVTDTVIRLRRFTETDSSWRTIEIEKARARTHAVGQHAFEILNEKGSSTGSWQNPDEPECANSYFQIYYAIHHRDRQIRQHPTPGIHDLSGNPAKFGIPYLDEMLPAVWTGEKTKDCGLPWGSLTALVGDAGTGKSLLACSFLCEGASKYADSLTKLSEELKGKKSEFKELLRCCEAVLNWKPAVKSANPQEEWFYIDGEDLSKHEQLDHTIIRRLAIAQDWPGMRAAIAEIARPAIEALDRHFGDLETFQKRFTDRLPKPKSKHPFSRRQFPWSWMTENEKPTSAPALANWLLRHPAFAQPMIFITTSDIEPNTLADNFAKWIAPQDKPGRRKQNYVREYIRRNLICRRLNVQGTPASRLYHVIERCWIEAQWMVWGPIVPALQDVRYKPCGNIRMVIDDFRTLRSMYPDLTNDPLFLPFLRSQVRAEGITTLIVCTDPGRPDKDPTDEWSRELRSLSANQILTWQVPFFGRAVSAITVVPGEGLIRQLVFSGRPTRSAPKQGSGGSLETSQRPDVDPQFDLYEGLEQGVPKPVPLEVRLYSETPVYEQYIREENRLFREAFGGGTLKSSSSDVIVGLRTGDYDGLRDTCPLPVDTHRDHSLVFQVDEFWALNRSGALAIQRHYLDQMPDDRTDAFRLFRPTQGGGGGPKSRLHYFENEHYETRIDDKRDGWNDRVDRVPFMWDFGFLLLKHDYWREASSAPLPLLVKHCLAKWKLSGNADIEERLKSVVTVGRIFDALPNVNCAKALQQPWLAWADIPPQMRKKIHEADRDAPVRFDTWRAFLEAARVVGERVEGRLGRPVPRYEIASVTPESISCQVLEMWLSEIYGDSDDRMKEKLREGTSARKFEEPVKFGLVNLLEDTSWGAGKPRGSFETRNALLLYKVWLMLIEVLDFASLSAGGSPFEFPLDRESPPEAVACRHWYKTASAAMEKCARTDRPSELYIPVRLPGTFSARGDWYLAATEGNRSERLAHRAIDLLSSRRANLRRMQLGLGLPTRDILPGKQVDDLRTALRCSGDDAIAKNVTYGELSRIAGPGPRAVPGKFLWLWRSGLKDYDRQSRAWQRWINRLFLWSHEYRHQQRHNWKGGFEPYDEIERNTFDSVSKFNSFKEEFPKHIKLLLAELKQSSPRN